MKQLQIDGVKKKHLTSAYLVRYSSYPVESFEVVQSVDTQLNYAISWLNTSRGMVLIR